MVMSVGSLHEAPVKVTPNGAGFAVNPAGNAGVGAFGTVWLATTRESGRRVAMKIVERKRQVRRSRRASEGLGGPRSSELDRLI